MNEYKTFLLEARIMRRKNLFFLNFSHTYNFFSEFDHPNVIKMYGVAVNLEPLYIIMEFIESGSIDKILQKAVKDETPVIMDERMAKMLLPAGWGLEYLHAQKCIHRDIAARNCLYTKDKTVCLLNLSLITLGPLSQDYEC